jgi:DNA-binding transcriptional LysR family regulator
MCVVPKGMRTHAPGVITVDELRSHTFVVQDDSTDADIQAFLAKYKLNVRASCRVVDDMSTLAMVESGFGISILPSLILRRTHGDVDAYPIEPMEYREFGIAVLNPQMVAPAVRQMAAHIEAYAKVMRAQDQSANQGFDPKPMF